MNERIFDMARQSGATDENGRIAEHVFCFTKSELSAFAELIIRECIDCLKPLSRNHSMVGAARDTIKQHFGVEE